MRTAHIVALVLLAIGAALPGALFAVDGQVLYTEGTVTISTGSGSRDASPGDKLSAGDVITTGPVSLAVIDLSNATQAKLRENTSLAIEAIGNDTKVSLTRGGLFTHVLKKLSGTLSVRADTTVAGVRGTEFYLAYGLTNSAHPDLWLCVNEGSVNVSLENTGQTVVVKEGLGVSILGGGRISTPRHYTWTRALNWNMDPSGGKVQDTTSLDQVYNDPAYRDSN
ncbi:MAG TPA: FecR family protein [Spirochaetia bacterium]|nr:FecR family protein [Spirochaetia bacterium]